MRIVPLQILILTCIAADVLFTAAIWDYDRVRERGVVERATKDAEIERLRRRLAAAESAGAELALAADADRATIEAHEATIARQAIELEVARGSLERAECELAKYRAWHERYRAWWQRRERSWTVPMVEVMP
ncbi:MAG TPA: hypothetical protein VHC22_32585 [Pirellulales bacterium]|nr:hypothetical protein [Pirellulales bacterium]